MGKGIESYCRKPFLNSKKNIFANKYQWGEVRQYEMVEITLKNAQNTENGVFLSVQRLIFLFGHDDKNVLLTKIEKPMGCKMLRKIIAYLAVLILFPVNSTQKRPNWIHSIPQKNNYKFYVGYSSSTESQDIVQNVIISDHPMAC